VNVIVGCVDTLFARSDLQELAKPLSSFPTSTSALLFEPCLTLQPAILESHRRRKHIHLYPRQFFVFGAAASSHMKRLKQNKMAQLGDI